VKRIPMDVARLPFEAGELARKVHGMLAGAAGDLKDESGFREPF